MVRRRSCLPRASSVPRASSRWFQKWRNRSSQTSTSSSLADRPRGLLAAGQEFEDPAPHWIAEHVEGLHVSKNFSYDLYKSTLKEAGMFPEFEWGAPEYEWG